MTDAPHVLDLTERQFTVLEGVAHRKTIKKIANEMGLSPSTVNEHLSAAKRRAGAHSTDELVALYFEDRATSKTDSGSTRTIDTGADFRVGEARETSQSPLQGDADWLTMADSGALRSSFFAGSNEPNIVPEELDGSDAVLLRLVHIAKLTGFILAATVLALVALQSVTSLMGT